MNPHRPDRPGYRRPGSARPEIGDPERKENDGNDTGGDDTNRAGARMRDPDGSDTEMSETDMSDTDTNCTDMTDTDDTGMDDTGMDDTGMDDTDLTDTDAGGAMFADLPEIDEATQQRLRARLASAAADAGILDVAYRTLDTPVGTLLLAATELGLVRVAYPIEDHDAVLEQLATRVSPRVLRAPARLDVAAAELEEYFAGRRHLFDLPLDFQLSTGFRRTVLSHLIDIGYGATASYAAIAVAAGNPKAVRAVGSACATNPLPVLVPCHRVVRSDGSIGQYAGGAEAKRALLRLEAAA